MKESESEGPGCRPPPMRGGPRTPCPACPHGCPTSFQPLLSLQNLPTLVPVLPGLHLTPAPAACRPPSVPGPPPPPAVSAVHDGFVLQKSVVSTPVAGRLLSQCMAAAVESRGAQIRPRFEFKRKEAPSGKLEVSAGGGRARRRRGGVPAPLACSNLLVAVAAAVLPAPSGTFHGLSHASIVIPPAPFPAAPSPSPPPTPAGGAGGRPRHHRQLPRLGSGGPRRRHQGEPVPRQRQPV